MEVIECTGDRPVLFDANRLREDILQARSVLAVHAGQHVRVVVEGYGDGGVAKSSLTTFGCLPFLTNAAQYLPSHPAQDGVGAGSRMGSSAPRPQDCVALMSLVRPTSPSSL